MEENVHTDLDEYDDDEYDDKYYYDEEDRDSDENSVQFLSFILNDELYGINVEFTTEVFEYKDVYDVPTIPEYICGIFNLRGEIVPIIDLSYRLFNKPGKVNENSSIVIVEVFDDSETVLIGVMVDAIQAVISIPAEEIDPSPAIGSKIRSDYITGVAKVDNAFMILLDTHSVLSIKELSDFI